MESNMLRVVYECAQLRFWGWQMAAPGKSYGSPLILLNYDPLSQVEV